MDGEKTQMAKFLESRRKKVEEIEELAEKDPFFALEIFENKWRKLPIGPSRRFLEKMKEHPDEKVRERAEKIGSMIEEETRIMIEPSITALLNSVDIPSQLAKQAMAALGEISFPNSYVMTEIAAGISPSWSLGIINNEIIEDLSKVMTFYEKESKSLIAASHLAGIGASLEIQNMIISPEIASAIAGITKQNQLIAESLGNIIKESGILELKTENLSPVFKELSFARDNWIISSHISELISVPPYFLQTEEIPEDIKIDVERQNKIIEEEFDYSENLKQYLAKIDIEYVGILEGAWEAFNSDNPDRFRQAATSMRELLVQLIEELSNDDELLRSGKHPPGFTKEDINRRMRISFILSIEGEMNKKTAKFIDSVASAITSLHPLLSEVTHTNFKDWETLYCFMKSTELAIYQLLLNRRQH